MPYPPIGTVTFLFTDIEGSTQLWEQHPDAMRRALTRHDQLLRQSIEQQGGYVFKTVGDAFCAAFAVATAALEAARAAQSALAAETWDVPSPLRVRMALHTGSAEERDGDYFGPPLNRVARLMSAGHGGQTLLSGAAQELVRDALPAGSALRDLGEHRLKDLGRPERVFQFLCLPWEDEFPPLRSLDNPRLPNNLPQQATSFVGRERELAEAAALLTKTRLLTLVGAGGAGKSRLSLQLAADLLTGEGDGVWLVELAALSDPALVPQAVADALGVREQPGKAMKETLAEALKPRHLLLILDNCEHLAAASATLASDLLRHCPGVHILASSREPLHIGGETVYRLPSLSLPDLSHAQTVETVSQYEAVRLFIDRAQAVRPDFSVSNANAPAVAQVCARLDGIPLAIELAAARVRSLPVEQIMTRLADRFRLLTGGDRAALPRQQTLQALIDWSYGLLTEGEKALLARLSVFAGGWTLDAAENVCGDPAHPPAAEDVLDVLMSLVDKSLVVYEERTGAGGRYRLLETMRQYAAGRLEDGESPKAARTRHTAFFLRLAENVAPRLAGRGPQQAEAAGAVLADYDNLRAVGERAAGADDAENSLRLAGALWAFWDQHGFYSEGRRWLSQALALPGTSIAPGLRARALTGAAILAKEQGDFSVSRDLCEQALPLFQVAGDRQGTGQVLNALANITYNQGDYVAARALYNQALELQRELDNPHGAGGVLSNLGAIAYYLGEYAQARALHQESLAIRRRLDDRHGIAISLVSLGNVAEAEGDYDSAEGFHRQSLAAYQSIGNRRGESFALNGLGTVAAARGDYEQARHYLEQCLAVEREMQTQKDIAGTLINLADVALSLGDVDGAAARLAESLTLFRPMKQLLGVASALEGLACVAGARRLPRQALRLLGAAESLRVGIGTPRGAHDRECTDQLTADARAALGDAAAQAALDEGQALPWEQAVEQALADRSIDHESAS